MPSYTCNSKSSPPESYFHRAQPLIYTPTFNIWWQWWDFSGHERLSVSRDGDQKWSYGTPWGCPCRSPGSKAEICSIVQYAHSSGRRPDRSAGAYYEVGGGLSAEATGPVGRRGTAAWPEVESHGASISPTTEPGERWDGATVTRRAAARQPAPYFPMYQIHSHVQVWYQRPDYRAPWTPLLSA